MTTADGLNPVFAEAAGIIAEALHADFYEIHRTARTPDAYGGTTTTVTILEAGRRCRLVPSNRLGAERLSGDVVRGASSYAAELPFDSDVKETDTLLINGTRTFEITELPKRGGRHGLFTEVSLEERR